MSSIERVIVDECVGQDSPLVGQLRQRFGEQPVKFVFLATKHPGIPDIEILDKLLDVRSALLTQDRVLHNPNVALGACGNNNNNVKVDKSLKAVAATSEINPVPAAHAINLSFIPKGITALDSMTLHPVTAADLSNGHWITIAQTKNGKTEAFQASVFKVSEVNNNQKVVELWVAELPGGGTAANILGLKIGQKFVNVSEDVLLGKNKNN